MEKFRPKTAMEMAFVLMGVAFARLATVVLPVTSQLPGQLQREAQQTRALDSLLQARLA